MLAKTTNNQRTRIDTRLHFQLHLHAGAMAWLSVLNGPKRGEFKLGAAGVSIGRASACDVVLEDNSVSPQQAAIRFENGHFSIYDCGTNPDRGEQAYAGNLRVNGLPVKKQELRHNDEIQIGNTIMRFIQTINAEDLAVEARRRLRTFFSVWEQLMKSARNV